VAPVLRRATTADAAALARIGATTFTETFGHLYPASDLAPYLAEAYDVDATRAMLGRYDCAAWLLEIDGAPIGHALAGACGLPHPEVRPGDGELKRLYLVRAHQNGGQGARLFRAAMAWLERDGPRTLWIGVWSQNLGAQRFYARHGFERVGDYDFIVGSTRDHEYILRRLPAA
jgi:ribosomal protein S18 acetylase RimI-like enzyme